MNQDAWKELVMKHFEAPMKAFVKEAVMLEVIPKADAYVAGTSTKLDDMLWAAAKEAILKGLDQV